MTLSPEHEQWKRLIGRLLVALTEELGLPLAEYGSMTMKRRSCVLRECAYLVPPVVRTCGSTIVLVPRTSITSGTRSMR